MTDSEEELKSLLRKVKVEREKVGLKCNIQKTKIMASGPIRLTGWGRAAAGLNWVYTASVYLADGAELHLQRKSFST